jgi:signal transduction histidine kinase
MHNSRFKKLLLANAAHEVRTPLNAIINYLEIALEAPLDHNTREYVSKSHAASQSLIYAINGLLDLTKPDEILAVMYNISWPVFATETQSTYSSFWYTLLPKPARC